MSAKTIYDTLVKAGMTPKGACAMLGNMRAESAMRSNNVEDRSGIADADYTARADSGAVDFVNDRYGYGLCALTTRTRPSRTWVCGMNTPLRSMMNSRRKKRKRRRPQFLSP